MEAVKYNSVEIIKMLIEHGADINALDNNGNNALLYVNNETTMELLLSYNILRLNFNW